MASPGTILERTAHTQFLQQMMKPKRGEIEPRNTLKENPFLKSL